MKYKGQYRLKANIDKMTNDFPRDVDGGIDSEDIYIDCRNDIQIYHYGHSTLVAYIPSIIRGHNIIKSIFKECQNGDLGLYTKQIGTSKDNEPVYTINYELLYKDKNLNNIINNIVENDSEIEFRFNAKNIDVITKYITPRTSGANISPFSTKNLKKIKYDATTTAQMNEYKEIIGLLDKSQLLLINKLTNCFLTDILSKNKAYRNINIKNDMKKKMLKPRDYIHSEGFWDEYLTYMKKEISEVTK